MGVGLFRGALRQGRGVTQGEDDGLLVEGRHVLDNLGGEHSGHAGGADETSGLDGFHDVAKLLHLLMRVGERGL